MYDHHQSFLPIESKRQKEDICFLKEQPDESSLQSLGDPMAAAANKEVAILPFTEARLSQSPNVCIC